MAAICPAVQSTSPVAFGTLTFGGKNVPVEAVRESCMSLGGQALTARKCRELAWRLAANLETLRAGRPVTPWVRQDEPEWVAVQVTGARYAIQKRAADRRGRPGLDMRFTVLTGTPAATTIAEFWSDQKVDAVAYNIGFKRKPPMYKADRTEVFGCRFWALVEPRLSLGGPKFYRVHATPAFEASNAALIKKRRRIKFPCPMAYTHECHRCPVGAGGEDRCPAATHRADYEFKKCETCGRENAAFDTDPAYVNDYCLRCQPLISAGLQVKREGS